MENLVQGRRVRLMTKDSRLVIWEDALDFKFGCAHSKLGRMGLNCQLRSAHGAIMIDKCDLICFQFPVANICGSIPQKDLGS